MPSKHDHIGGAIRARRLELGLTQKELCARLGWKEGRISEISEIETGKKVNITLERLATIANALECHPGKLVFMLNTDLERTA